MQRGHPCARLCWCWISGLVTRIEQSSRLSATPRRVRGREVRVSSGQHEHEGSREGHVQFSGSHILKWKRKS